LTRHADEQTSLIQDKAVDASAPVVNAALSFYAAGFPALSPVGAWLICLMTTRSPPNLDYRRQTRSDAMDGLESITTRRPK
jgi:hypothetical protein